MSDTANTDRPAFIMKLTAEVVVAYVSNNSLPAADLPATIATIYAALGQSHAAPARESVSGEAETGSFDQSLGH